jgi:hypothetical protein
MLTCPVFKLGILVVTVVAESTDVAACRLSFGYVPDDLGP